MKQVVHLSDKDIKDILAKHCAAEGLVGSHLPEELAVDLGVMLFEDDEEEGRKPPVYNAVVSRKE